jgi:hypothetical protein
MALSVRQVNPLLGASIFILSLACGPSSASAQLTFNITNSGTASSQMMTGFAQAGALWSAYLKDSTTINIRVGSSALPAGVIGHSDIFYDSYAYTNVRAAMVNDRLSLDDFSSTEALQPAPAFSMLIDRTANSPNGVVSVTPYFDTGLGGAGQAGPENNSTLRMPAANAKALGLTSCDPILLDGIITFTTQRFSTSIEAMASRQTKSILSESRPTKLATSSVSPVVWTSWTATALRLD